MAEPPASKPSRVKTMRQLDAELASMNFVKRRTVIGNVDFSLLAQIALCPVDQCIEEDVVWDFDVVIASFDLKETN